MVLPLDLPLSCSVEEGGVSKRPFFFLPLLSFNTGTSSPLTDPNPSVIIYLHPNALHPASLYYDFGVMFLILLKMKFEGIDYVNVPTLHSFS